MNNYRIGYADIETYNDEGLFTPFLIITKIEKKIYTYKGLTCINDFIYLVARKNTIIYMHNLNFDGYLIIEWFVDTKNIIRKIKIINRDNDLYAIILETKSFTIEIRCSYRLIPMSLKKIGEYITNEKKKNFNHDLIKKNILDDEKLLKETEIYCLNDVLILEEALKKFNEEMLIWKVNIFNSKIYSISALSLQIFIKNFNINNLETNQKKFDELLRLSYYGGRCEVYGNSVEGETVKWNDFSSMYPNCMQNYKYPIDEGKFVLTPEKISDCGVYEIEFKSEMEIPVLPIKFENKLMFPNTPKNGSLIGVYYSDEIKLFIDEGGIIVKINWGIEYSKRVKIFENFVETFKKKKDENKNKKQIYKLLLNSLYGKFGSNTSNKKLIAKKEKKLKKIELTQIKKEEKINSNVIIALITTTLGRIKLYNTFKEVKDNGGRLLYCDTDSIFASFKDDKKHTWKLLNLNKINEEVFFMAPKAYLRGKDAIIKGFKIINYDFNERSNKNDLIELLNLGVMQTRFKRIKTKIWKQEYKKKINSINTKRSWTNEKMIYTEPVLLEYYDNEIKIK